MVRMGYLLITIIFSLILLGCSGSQKEAFSTGKLPDEIYANIKKKLRRGKWKQAIMQLEYFNNRYPSHPYFQQTQLDLIYAYYKNNDLLLSRSAIDRFIRFNPVHPNIDYVVYMRGLINMEMDNNALPRFFGINRFDCDPNDAQNAFNDFSSLVRNYPNSQYTNDAIKRMIFLKNRLAIYEYSVAKYYSRRGEWKAVINRVKGMLHDYPDTQATRLGLKLLENAYRKMKMSTEAEQIAQVINSNFIK